MGQLAALQQIKRDSEALDRRSIAVGPFARLDANDVAERDGKTRGVISHLFGSQSAFQVETMARALDAGDWIEQLEFPAPADHPDAGAWVEALFAAESARGPQRGARPKVDYAALWALWLSAVPVRPVERARQRAEHGGAGAVDRAARARVRRRRSSTSACGCARASRSPTWRARPSSLIEGAWLNQCLTPPDDTFLRRSGRLLWDGATEPA